MPLVQAKKTLPAGKESRGKRKEIQRERRDRDRRVEKHRERREETHS